MFSVAFVHPSIPPNTGNAIRLAAATGVHLHLVEPMGFDLDDAKLRRAGLDYHDLANVTVHPDLDAAWHAWRDAPRVFAFTTKATRIYSEVHFAPGDVFLFGNEQDGLPDAVLDDPRVTERLRVPMLAGRRSLNLSNTAALVTYEAWRQQGFAGA